MTTQNQPKSKTINKKSHHNTPFTRLYECWGYARKREM